MAQDMLAQAGYPNGAGFPTVSILYNTTRVTSRLLSSFSRNGRTTWAST
jgi:hypothetical protein